jgi:plasmid rolling circle replication initiator protein Rep
MPVCNILQDGKRPWREHKMANTLLAAAYDDVDDRKAERLRECASRLTFARTATGKRLRGANFCRVRLCPMCTWRRSLKTFMQVQKIMAYLKKEGLAYSLLTLTVRNVPGEELKATIDAMQKGWDRFSKVVPIAAVMKGYFKSLEITHNVKYGTEGYDTYHPHFHVLMALRPSYFKSRFYISQAKFAEFWRQAAGLDYDPMVDVRRVKGDTAGAVAEVAKYAVKPGDFIIPDDWELTVETVRLLDKALDKRRFVSFGGVMREAHKALNLDDEADGDLINVDEAQEQKDLDEVLETYVWNSGYNQFFYDM